MRFTNCLEAVKINTASNKKRFIKSVIMFILLFLVCSSILAYTFTVNQALIIDDQMNLSDNCISGQINLSTFKDDSVYQSIAKQENVVDVVKSANLYFLEMLSDNLFFTPPNTPTINPKNVEVQFWDKFSNVLSTEFKAKTGKDSFMLYGKVFENKDEFVCTESYLTKIGITDIESSIGKKFDISAQLLNDTGNANYEFLSNGTLVGVVSDEISTLGFYGNKKTSQPIIYLHTDTIQKGSSNMLLGFNVFFESFLQKQPLRNNIDALLGDNGHTLKSSDSDAFVAIEGYKKVVNAIFIVISIIIVLTVLTNLIHSMYQNIKSQKSHYAILLSNGMSKKALWLIVFVELLLQLLIAIIVMGILTAPLMLAINQIILSLIGIAVPFNFAFFGISLCIEFAVGIILAVIICFIPLIFFKNKVKV